MISCHIKYSDRTPAPNQVLQVARIDDFERQNRHITKEIKLREREGNRVSSQADDAACAVRGPISIYGEE